MRRRMKTTGKRVKRRKRVRRRDMVFGGAVLCVCVCLCKKEDEGIRTVSLTNFACVCVCMCLFPSLFTQPPRALVHTCACTITCTHTHAHIYKPFLFIMIIMKNLGSKRRQAKRERYFDIFVCCLGWTLRQTHTQTQTQTQTPPQKDKHVIAAMVCSCGYRWRTPEDTNTHTDRADTHKENADGKAEGDKQVCFA
jgi:hypothetical protein